MSEDITPYNAASYRQIGRPGLHQIDVDRTADALLQKGERPSIEKVRAQVGGSPNTIGPLLDDWWRRLAARVQVGAGAFERLPGSLAHLAEALYLQALEEARRAVHQEERRERDALTRAQHEVNVRSHVLALRDKELQARLEDQARRIEALELELKDRSLLARKLQASKDAAEARAVRLATELEQARAPRRAAIKPRAKRTSKRAGTGRRAVTRARAASPRTSPKPRARVRRRPRA